MSKKHHLWHHNQLPCLCINSLHHSRYCPIPCCHSSDESSAVHWCNLLIGDGENDVGLRLRASFWSDLQIKAHKPTKFNHLIFILINITMHHLFLLSTTKPSVKGSPNIPRESLAHFLCPLVHPWCWTGKHMKLSDKNRLDALYSDTAQTSQEKIDFTFSPHHTL